MVDRFRGTISPSQMRQEAAVVEGCPQGLKMQERSTRIGVTICPVELIVIQNK